MDSVRSRIKPYETGTLGGVQSRQQVAQGRSSSKRMAPCSIYDTDESNQIVDGPPENDHATAANCFDTTIGGDMNLVKQVRKINISQEIVFL